MELNPQVENRGFGKSDIFAGKEIMELGIQEKGAEQVLRQGGSTVIFNEKDEVAVIEFPEEPISRVAEGIKKTD